MQGKVLVSLWTETWPKCPSSPSLSRKHLSIRRFSWWARFIAINTSLFFLFFFLTTPAIIINTIDMYNVTRPIEKLQVPLLLRMGVGEGAPRTGLLDLEHLQQQCGRG